MNPKKVEELLKLYSEKVPEERLLPVEKEEQLKARLKKKAEEEASALRLKRFGLRGLALAAAAGIMGIMFLFVFSETRVWKGGLIKAPPSQRGEQEPGRYYFEITPGFDGYVYILNLDAAGSLRFVFPFLDEAGMDDFGLKGPFESGIKIRIPPDDPEGFMGYALTGDGRDEYFLVIPSDAPLGEEMLRDMLLTLKQEGELEKKDPKERSRAVQEWLESRYPHTFLIRLNGG